MTEGILGAIPFITEGYGEYIVFSVGEGGKKEGVSPEIYAQFHKILGEQRHSWYHGDHENRYERLRGKVKEIDPSLEVAFVPRTLYEMCCIYFFLKKIHTRENVSFAIKQIGIVKRLVVISDDFPLEDDYEKGVNYPSFVHIAYRINQIFTLQLQQVFLGFTKEKIREISQKLLVSFFRLHIFGEHKIRYTLGGLNFDEFDLYELFSGYYPRGFDSESIRNGIRQLIELECSDLAKTHFFLYRGGNILHDNVVAYTEIGMLYHSISFGTGLFAGVLFDRKACVFNRMSELHNDGFIFPIAYQDFPTSIFTFPIEDPIRGLAGQGEHFHARVKVSSKDEKILCDSFENIDHDGPHTVKEVIDMGYGMDLEQRSIMRLFNYARNRAIIFLAKEFFEEEEEAIAATG